MRNYVMIMGLGVFACGLSGLSGCATVLSGTEQKVAVTTTPSGATVEVDGGARQVTPVDLKLARRDDHTLLISMPGYQSERVSIRKEFNPAFLGNILLGGVVGGVADYASGAAASLKPDKVNVVLTRLKAGEIPSVNEWNPPDKAPSNPTTGAKGTPSSAPARSDGFMG